MTQAPSADQPTLAPKKLSGIEAVLGLEEAATTPIWRRVLLAALVLLVILAVLYGFFWPGETGEVNWVFGEVTRGDLIVTVAATGTVEPTNEVEISSELSGTVQEVYVDFNDQVTKGQVLAVLNTDNLEALAAVCSATLAARQAKVLEAKATVTEKEHGLARARRLARSGTQSAEDLDTTLAAYHRALAAQASAEAEVHVAEADLRIKLTNLSKARIVSPINGVVLERNVEPGQTVAASLSAPVLFTLAEDLRRMELQVDVDEADVGVTKAGQPATFTVDAYPEKSFPARLHELRYASKTTNNVVTYKAILSIDNSDLLLRPGMTATAEITVQKLEDVLLVPNEALRFEPPSDSGAAEKGLLESLLPGRPKFREAGNQAHGTRVWVLQDGIPAAVNVKTGPSDGSRTVVPSGDLIPAQKVMVDVRD